jgi:hypothetical protein
MSMEGTDMKVKIMVFVFGPVCLVVAIGSAIAKEGGRTCM